MEHGRGTHRTLACETLVLSNHGHQPDDLYEGLLGGTLVMVSHFLDSLAGSI